jgi:hypothetical protein
VETKLKSIKALRDDPRSFGELRINSPRLGDCHLAKSTDHPVTRGRRGLEVTSGPPTPFGLVRLA